MDNADPKCRNTAAFAVRVSSGNHFFPRCPFAYRPSRSAKESANVPRLLKFKGTKRQFQHVAEAAIFAIRRRSEFGVEERYG